MLDNLSAGLSLPISLLRPERLTPDLLAAVTYRNLAAREAVYYRGDKAVAVFAVERGRLQLFSYTSEGKPVPLYVIRAGECVAEAALFADAYCGDVVAEIPSRVAMFRKGPLLQAFHERPALSDEFMARLTHRFNLLRIRLELRNLQSARERVLQYFQWTVSPDQTSVLLDRPLIKYCRGFRSYARKLLSNARGTCKRRYDNPTERMHSSANCSAI